MHHNKPKRRYTTSNRISRRRIGTRDKYGKSVCVGDVVVNPRIVYLDDDDPIPPLLSHHVHSILPDNRCTLEEYPSRYVFDIGQFVRVRSFSEPGGSDHAYDEQ